ncbi:thioredoxin domain-containing protein [Caulobacter sp. S45]|uniref:thioredoxin domain-containing protein n=1 Tax=Caulobacter sp. S45 TaxID=1641861 RepID=UPI00157569CC|nr:thioredoxin domain-containing protein [Caulobacter sp. S45]
MRAAIRRLTVAMATAIVLSPATSRAAPPSPPARHLPQPFTAAAYVMGSAHAKVTIAEYASVACPHCARFDAQVFPALKARYVDTGKVRFELHEMLVGSPDMVQVAAAGFMLARCAGQTRYFPIVEAIYRAQPEIFSSNDPKSIFVRIAKDNGLDETQMDACISDKANIDALNQRVKYATDVAKIDSTPTFILNGTKLDEHGREPDIALFDAALQPLLAKAPAARSHR